MPVVTLDEIEINNDVILDGVGSLSVDGDDDHRVFSVPEDVEAELRGIVVTNGTVSNDVGGGILNQGTLTLTDCTVSENSAGNQGGGIMNTGPIADPNSGVLTVTTSTVSGNTAADSGGGIDSGRTPTVLTVTNCTVSGNAAGVAGDAFFAAAATLTNSIVDGECDGPLTSNGYNIESPGNTCGFDQTGDQVSVTEEDLNLGPLANNSGLTLTHKPGAGGFGFDSAAIDKIPEAACYLDSDQRHRRRPSRLDPRCDVGSVEVGLEL